MLRKITPLAFLLLAALQTPAATRYIVALKQPHHNGGIAAVLHGEAEVAQHRVRQFENLDSFAADLTADEAADLKRSPGVRYVEEVAARSLLEDEAPATLKPAPELSQFSVQQTTPWGVTAIHAPELWNLAAKAAPVNVVILDTGIDATHPDLAAAYAGGYNTFDTAAAPVDDNGHGTHVAGTIAAQDNGFGVVGVAPNTRIWSIKVLDSHGKGDTEKIVAGLDWVLSKSKSLGGKWIVSLSLGGPEATTADREAFQTISDNGILAVAAAGNTGLGAVVYPGAYPTVIATGAIDQTFTRAGFSSFGPNMGVAAPGVGVLSTARVGSIPAADVAIDGGATLNAFALRGSPRRDVTSSFVFCKLGRPEDFPPGVAGRVAVIERGCGTGTTDGCDLTFNEKVKNAMAAGATAAVIYNFKGGKDDIAIWTLIRQGCENTNCSDYQPDLDYPWILALGVSYDDGQKILASSTLIASARGESYQSLNGTSMATPHASGAASLVWSIAPDATAQDVRNALFRGAADLGTTGYDLYYGYGMVNALASAKLLAPSLFGLPPLPQT